MMKKILFFVFVFGLFLTVSAQERLPFVAEVDLKNDRDEFSGNLSLDLVVQYNEASSIKNISGSVRVKEILLGDIDENLAEASHLNDLNCKTYSTQFPNEKYMIAKGYMLALFRCEDAGAQVNDMFNLTLYLNNKDKGHIFLSYGENALFYGNF